LLRYVAFPSAVVASSLNCYIVGSPEIESGIPLENATGQDVLPGTTSQVAAAQGVYLTTASRALLQAPALFVPPVLLAAVPTVPLTTYLLLVSFGIGLPATVAIFPQISALPATAVEERFQLLRDPATDKPYDLFYYNKGL
jgi:sideroflexin-5